MLNSLNKITLAIFISSYAGLAYSSAVRGDIGYQYFRDFAENKGQFSVGARNVPIYDKQGVLVGTMFSQAPMPDLSATNIDNAYLTLINPQYTSGVSHNKRISQIKFGATKSSLYSYSIVDRNDHPYEDYQIPRLDKLVTEVVPAPLSTVGYDGNQIRLDDYFDTDRFPVFVRLGSGRQFVRSAGDRTQEKLAEAYAYITGGNALPLFRYESYGATLKVKGPTYGSELAPMGTYGTPGDSGSPLYAFDRRENRWVVAGTQKTYHGERDNRNGFTVSLPRYVEATIAEDTLSFTNRADTLNWATTSANSSLISSQDGNQRITVDLADPNQKAQDTLYTRPSLAHGKSLEITGNDGTLVLNNDIDQGAGYLRFNANFTVKPQEDQKWNGAGIIVEAGKQVNWQVKNPPHDRLAKLGEGTLYVDGKGWNLGYLSLGEGKVVLDYKRGEYSLSPFSRVEITSGRGTLSLANDQQMRGTNIEFGFRGGRLDLNGTTLSSARIMANDDGANIVNHNLSARAVLTVANKIATAEDIEWRKPGEEANSALAIYRYFNPYQKNRSDYFLLKGNNPLAAMPIDGTSNQDWEFLGSEDRKAVIQTALNKENRRRTTGYNDDTTLFAGHFGEGDSAKPNGRLEVIYDFSENFLSTITGGSQLNGTLRVRGGHLLLSGRPVPYAKDALNDREIVNDKEWLNRTFNATQFEASNNSTLYVGRNIQAINGEFKANDNGKIQLGFIQGKTPVCIGSDYNFRITCNNDVYLSDEVYASVPTTQAKGNVTLSQNGWLLLGKSHLQGTIQASANSRVSIGSDSLWTMSAESTLGHLAMDSGTITLNPQFESASAQSMIKQFNRLTINGNLTGNGRFNFLTNAAELKGDNIIVNGLATGVFSLALKNTGQEPRAISPVSLIQLNHPEQNNYSVNISLSTPYVDLGAYRYILKKDQFNDYRLYSPAIEATGGKLIDVDYLLKLAKQQQELIARLERQIEQERQQQQQAQNTANNVRKEVQKAENEVKKAENWYERGKRFWWFAPRILARRAQNLEHYQRQATEAKTRLSYAENSVNEYQTSIESAMKVLAQARQELASTQTKLDSASQNRPAMLETYKQRAKSLCLKERYTEAVCETVAEKIATTESEQAMEDFEQAVTNRNRAEGRVAQEQDRYQTALQAVSSAENSANADQLSIAREQLADVKQQLDLANHELEQKKKAEAEALIALNKAEQRDEENARQALAKMPVKNQSDWISQYANTALSEISTQANSLLQAGTNLDRHLLDLNRQSESVWVNYDWAKTQNRSDHYRPYQQRNQLTQLGVEQSLTDSIRIGAVLSRAEANNDFADDGLGKSRLWGLSTFLKAESEQGLFATVDASYWRSKNRLKQASDEAIFNRNMLSVGVNAGKSWTLAGVDIQPSIGARYYRLAKTHYLLDGANIENPTTNFVSYTAGLKVSKTFEINPSMHFTPTLASYYTDASQRKFNVKVNDHSLEQRVGRYVRNEVSFASQFKQWQAQMTFSTLNGNEVGKQKNANFKVSYQF